MLSKVIKTLFFGNYFVGILAVALAVEFSLQLGVPLNSPLFYLMFFCVPVAYYNYAYIGATTLNHPVNSSSGHSSNPRSTWILANRKQLIITQKILVIGGTVLAVFLLLNHLERIPELPAFYWVMLWLAVLAAILYDGLLPIPFLQINLRNTGWLKPIIIGFVWACTVGLIPLLFLQISSDTPPNIPSYLWHWLFVKNWMFCSVNAIMFDIKDYEMDMNHQLKTFVVRFGIYKTIAYIILPLLIVGLVAFLIFAYGQNFSPLRIILNMIPFLLTITVAFWMYRKKEILFYLIVIDGLLLVKALCGSLAALL